MLTNLWNCLLGSLMTWAALLTMLFPTQGGETVQVIADPEFREGFACSTAESSLDIVGEVASPAAAEGAPRWKLDQWACKNEISGGDYTADAGGYACVTDSQRVAVSWRGGGPLLTLELKASREYDAPREEGQPWPHLLIEQRDLAARCPKLDRLKKLRLRFAAQIAYCDSHMEQADPGLHAAQVTLFFSVQSVETHDMFWFGVPVFDTRALLVPAHMAQDGGKPDAGENFIYTPAQVEFTRRSAHSGRLLAYDADLLPYIIKGLERAYAEGYLNSSRLGDYTLTTCNLGYEMPGTYDSAFELYRFTLDAVLK